MTDMQRDVKRFFETFLGVFLGILVPVVGIVIGITFIVLPVRYINGTPGIILAIFNAIIFVALLITCVEEFT